jgi:hypothetical protein
MNRHSFLSCLPCLVPLAALSPPGSATDSHVRNSASTEQRGGSDWVEAALAYFSISTAPSIQVLLPAPQQEPQYSFYLSMEASSNDGKSNQTCWFDASNDGTDPTMSVVELVIVVYQDEKDNHQKDSRASSSSMFLLRIDGHAYAWTGGRCNTTPPRVVDRSPKSGALAIPCLEVMLSFGLLWRFFPYSKSSPDGDESVYKLARPLLTQACAELSRVGGIGCRRLLLPATSPSSSTTTTTSPNASTSSASNANNIKTRKRPLEEETAAASAPATPNGVTTKRTAVDRSIQRRVESLERARSGMETLGTILLTPVNASAASAKILTETLPGWLGPLLTSVTDDYAQAYDSKQDDPCQSRDQWNQRQEETMERLLTLFPSQLQRRRLQGRMPGTPWRSTPGARSRWAPTPRLDLTDATATPMAAWTLPEMEATRKEQAEWIRQRHLALVLPRRDMSQPEQSAGERIRK